MDEKEVKGNLLKLEVVRSHEAEYLIKNVLGNNTYAIVPRKNKF